VAEFLWENRSRFTGVSLLQAMGDKTYVQAPMEAVNTAADAQRWNLLAYNPVPYGDLSEREDVTKLAQVVACAGGVCELHV
jgi:ribonucleoside-triphosphate reductase (thioredoxin)